MLKIKDDIDLKELEKFGFEDLDWLYYYSKERGKLTFNISIYKKGRHITTTVITRDYIHGRCCDSLVDILYDLINANMVEKV